MAANSIAENVLAQVDDQGHWQLLLDEILDHRTDMTALTSEQAIFTTKNGIPRRKQTTKGWQLYANWKDGSGN